MTLTLGSSGVALAVDGFSVTTHWSGINDIQFGGVGEIWRHDIEGGQVVAHERLDAGPARSPVISPAGDRVAFLRKDGMIVVVPARPAAGSPGDGHPGDNAAAELAQTHPEAHLDWPRGDWIYYSLGGYHQYGSSRYLRRVNAKSSVDEPVVRFNRGTWRFAISSDLQRAVVRADDEPVEPWGRIVAYDMAGGGGELRLERATDRFSCSLGIDPSGTYFLDGWQFLHDGTDVRRWDDLQPVLTLSHKEAASWGGPDSGLGHNLNNWSVNDTSWISVHLGWGIWGSTGANQVLYNWVDKQRIVVTSNTDGSYAYDSSGDFWVAGAEPTPGELLPPSIEHAPRDVQVIAGERATFDVSASSGGSMSYHWQRDCEPVTDAADHWSYSTPPTTLADDGALFRCLVRDARGETTSAVARLSVLPPGTKRVNSPPVVSAGIDALCPLGKQVLLVATVQDDGLPSSAAGRLSYSWSQVDGPTTARLATPERDRTLAELDAKGAYTFQLVVDDGEERTSDEVLVVVKDPRTIKVLSPAGGEVWAAGSTQHIRWEAIGVEDVTIHYSVDDGKTWELVAPSVDTSSPEWGNVAWKVPGRASKRCRVALSAYVDGSAETRSAPFEIEIEPIDQPYQFKDSPPADPPPPAGCGLGHQGHRTDDLGLLLFLLSIRLFLRSRRRRDSAQ